MLLKKQGSWAVATLARPTTRTIHHFLFFLFAGPGSSSSAGSSADDGCRSARSAHRRPAFVKLRVLSPDGCRQGLVMAWSRLVCRSPVQTTRSLLRTIVLGAARQYETILTQALSTTSGLVFGQGARCTGQEARLMLQRSTSWPRRPLKRALSICCCTGHQPRHSPLSHARPPGY